MTAATGISRLVYARRMLRRSSPSSGTAASSNLHATKRSVPAAPPRIRDLADRRLYVADSRADHGVLKPLIGGAVNFRIIEENWDEILRLAASIRAGTVAPSVAMRRLAAYPRQNAVAKALREIGSIERTPFTLDWITDPALRRRSNAGLNKGEARNALARTLFFHRHGEIRDGTFENQSYRVAVRRRHGRDRRCSRGLRQPPRD
jgi:TnpA family transposase